MKLVNEVLAAQLLEAGKQEFLTYGFQKASMRHIAASLGVTTGAIYRYYKNKDALFEAIVGKPAKELYDLYCGVQDEFKNKPLEGQLESLPEISNGGQKWMMTYLYDNFDAFKLIACCSAGTVYENYIDSLIQVETDASRRLIDQMIADGRPVKPLDDELIHILSNTLFSGMFETIRHDMPGEKAMDYLDSLKDFYSAGWFKILGI